VKSGVVRRADGDLHTDRNDGTSQALETEDDDSPGDAHGFRFANRDQRNDWIVMLVTPMMNHCNNHPGNELHTGAQTVNGNDVEIDFQVNEGTLGDQTNRDFVAYAEMFGARRDGNSHQVWDM
jgi:hypothetical protein